MSYRVFDLLADKYDEWYRRNRVIAENELKLIRSMGIERPCLEVGVGTGFFASALSVDVGIDPSIGMLRIARSRDLEVVQSFGEYLPFRRSCFRTILLIATLCFLDKPYEAILECTRVLAHGGKAISCIVPRDSSWGRYYQELGRRGHPFYSQARFLTVDEMNELFRSAGLELLGMWGTLSFTPWEEPRLEEPIPWSKGVDLGFICASYAKIY